MRISGIEPRTLDLKERPGVRRGRGEETFSVDAAGAAEPPADGEQGVLYAERSGNGRRRVLNRVGRRAEVHGKHAAAEEAHRLARGEADFTLERHGDDTPGEAEDGDGEDRAEQAAAADFATLATHLSRLGGLGGLAREVTLYLPSLGQVSARLEAGAITVVASVPRRLLAAVRRGEPELQKRLEQAGLRVAHLKITPLAQEDPPAPPAPARPGRDAGQSPVESLIDVMA